MPDNKNESKFMAMLERKGIVRKADSEENQPETDHGIVPSRPDTELRSIFNPPAGDVPKVTPAARQPVPGISTPILPSAQQQNTERESLWSVESRNTGTANLEQPRAVVNPVPDQQRIIEPQYAGQTAAEVPTEQASFTRSPDDFSGSTFPNESFIAVEGAGISGIPHQPQTEDFTDRYLDIEELYEALALKSKRTDTVYLVEEYLKSLPDSLPEESRREIVGKIVAASGFSLDLLMGDGVLRVKMLKEYAERFAHYTDEYIAARQNELDELDQQILRLRKLIENRRELHKKQFFTIEAEAQRLKDILSFITG